MSADSNPAAKRQKIEGESSDEELDSEGRTKLISLIGDCDGWWTDEDELDSLLTDRRPADLVKLMLLQDKKRRNILHYAVTKRTLNEAGSLKLLLSTCSRLGVLRELLQVPDTLGVTPWRQARRAGYAAVLTELASYEATVTEPLQESELDCSSAHDAVSRGHLGCLRLLLSRHRSLALQLDSSGESPLHLIDHNMAPQCHEITAALLDAAADTPAALAAALKALGKDGELALQHAASFHWEANCDRRMCHPCLRAFIAAGADACAEDRNGVDLIMDVINDDSLGPEDRYGIDV
eukprot:904-Heterococcus_DN1.PRE.2